MRFFAIILCATFFLLPFSGARAQTGGKPLEITADETLEWHRNDKKYIARGNAVALQGDMSLNAGTLTATYTDDSNGSSAIRTMIAESNVVLTSQGSSAYGDRADYDVATGLAIMTGNALKMVSPDHTVTARDKFEYNVPEGKLSAIGNAIAVQGKSSLNADRISAFFIQESQGGTRKLSRIEAHGNVVIKTPTEILTGAKGVWQAQTNVAEVTGNVKIVRGPNILEGERAEVNLTTNISRMFGGPAAGRRVRGVFYPGSEKESPQNPAQADPRPTAPDRAPLTSPY